MQHPRSAVGSPHTETGEPSSGRSPHAPIGRSGIPEVREGFYGVRTACTFPAVPFVSTLTGVAV
jgi:hypothetical protein